MTNKNLEKIFVGAYDKASRSVKSLFHFIYVDCALLLATELIGRAGEDEIDVSY